MRWLARNRLLRILAVAIALMNLTLSATLSLSVLYAQERLGLGSVGYGLLLSSMAVGGITASLVADRVIGRLGPATTMRVGLVIESSTHLVLALARSPLLVGVVFALFGFHAMTWSVISVSLRQELIPARLLGRVNSAYALFGFGSLALGAVAGGLLAARYGLTAPFWCSFAADDRAHRGLLADPRPAPGPLWPGPAPRRSRPREPGRHPAWRPCLPRPLARRDGRTAPPRPALLAVAGVDVGHVHGAVALAGDRPAGGDLLDRGQVAGAQLDLQGAERSPPGSCAAWSPGWARRRRPGPAPRRSPAGSGSPPCRPRAPAPARPGRGCGRSSPPENRGWSRRKSSSPKSSGEVIRPDRNPRPSGL